MVCKLCVAAGLMLLAASGCRMCDSPYDYCGPVVDSAPHGGEYGPLHEGEIIDEGSMQYEEVSPPQQVPTPARKPQAYQQARR